jgi:F0F1-type ATP synthase epsilon subunit
MFRKMMYLTSLMIVVLMLSACGVNIRLNPFTAEETVTQSFTTAAPPRIVVEMFNGGIDVVTGSDNTVKVDVIKRGGGISQAAAEDDLKNVEVTIAQDGDTIRVTAKRADQRVELGNTGASASLRVPNGAILDLRTSNGPIGSSGPVGDVSAQTSNGPIAARGSIGQLKLSTSNGPITINGGSGSIDVETSNGPIDVTADNAVVVGRTSNGPFRFSGSLAQGRSEMRTSNGSIVVTLPANAQFVVNADTSNAKISSDFAVTAQSFSDDRLRGAVGNDPGTTLELHTSNGPIEIRKGQ